MMVFILPSATAYLGEFPMNSCVDIKVLSNCSSVDLSIVETNTQTYVIDAAMQNIAGQTFNYTFCNTTALGEYKYLWDENCVDCSGGLCGNNFEVTLSGVKKSSTLIISDIFLIILISLLIFILYQGYKKTDYSESDNKIGEAHDGKWSKTIMKTMGNNLMRNSFLWYYSLGWLLLIVLKDLLYNFNTLEIYNFFTLFTDIYSFGMFLVIIVWIGVLINHFTYITDLVQDLNLGVDR